MMRDWVVVLIPAFSTSIEVSERPKIETRKGGGLGRGFGECAKEGIKCVDVLDLMDR